jgi:Leucine-rich repeat (LRR) protein
MWLPQELTVEIGSYLNAHDLRVCTTQLCSSGAEFVSAGVANDSTTIRLQELIACCPSVCYVPVDDVAQECVERVESFVKRRGNVKTIILHAQIWTEDAANVSVYPNFHRRLQQGLSIHLNQKGGITVEWHVSPKSIAQVAFLLNFGAQQRGAGVSGAAAGGALRQYLHTLELWGFPVHDLSPLASCRSLHTLNLKDTEVRDVYPLASCQSLRTLNLSETKVRDLQGLESCRSLHSLDLWGTKVSDVSELASCQSLRTLDLGCTRVSDVSPLAYCLSLRTLNLSETQVRDVSALASCQSLYTLRLDCTEVRDVSALASCQSLHYLDLSRTQVSDVSALASCQSLRKLLGVHKMIGASDVLRIIQDRD